MAAISRFIGTKSAFLTDTVHVPPRTDLTEIAKKLQTEAVTQITAADFARIVEEHSRTIVSPAAPRASCPQGDDVVLSICNFLPLAELRKASAISRQWNRVISRDSFWHHRDRDLGKLFPKLHVIDERTWMTYVDVEKYELDVTGAPPLNKRTIWNLQEMTDLQVEGNAGITLALLPRGLTLNKLADFASAPKANKGNAIRLDCSSRPHIAAAHGDTPIEKTCRVIMTSNHVKNTRNLPGREQKTYIESLGYQMPGVLPAATVSILKRMSSSVADRALVHGGPILRTRCRSEDLGGVFWPIIVDRNPASAGFAIDNCYSYEFDGSLGALAMRESPRTSGT